MNELIEKLKDKNYVRAFGLMKPEEQECLRKAGASNLFLYNGQDWYSMNYFASKNFSPDLTYAIKSSYKPERFCRIPRGMDDYSFKFCDGPGTPKECKDCPEHISNKKKPEPEFVDLEISIKDDWLGAEKLGDDSMFLPFEHTHVNCLLSLPNFEGFYLTDGDDVEIRTEWVSRYHPGVIARFSTL